MLTDLKFRLQHSSRILAASAVLGIMLTPSAFAAPPGDIVLGDITIFRFTTAVGNITAEQRASMVQDRINQAISIPNITAKDVRMVVEASGPTIYVQKIKIVTIDPATAEAQGVKPIDLAKTWAHRLMGVIAQVCIRVPVTPPAGTGPEIAATPGQPASGTAAAPPTVAATTPAAPATSAPAPAAAPATPAAAPAAPVAPPAAPAVPVTPVAPADPAKPAPATPANPPAPASPATPPATPPAAPATPPVTPPVTPPATPPAGG